MKSIAKDILKISLIGVVVWLAINVGKPKAATVIPDVIRFSYSTPNNDKFYVTSWIEDGIKCSAVNYAYGERPVSVSCVKM